MRILTVRRPPKFVVEAVIIDSEPQVPIIIGMTLAGLKRLARLRSSVLARENHQRQFRVSATYRAAGILQRP